MKININRQLVGVIAVVVLITISMQLLQPILPLYLTSLNIPPATLGLMLAMITIGMVFGEGFWGWIADKIGLRIPLGLATLVCAIVLFVLVLTQQIPAMFLLFLIWGVARSAAAPIGRGYIGATAPLLQKAQFMAIYSMILAAARSGASFTGGFVVDTLGYQWAFYIASAIVLLGGIIVMAGLKNVRPSKTYSVTTVTASMTSPFPTKVVTLSLLLIAVQCTVAFLHHCETGILRTYLPLAATETAHASATQVGILFTVSELVSIAIFLPMGWLADHKGKKTLMILGLLVAASGEVGISFSHSFSWFLVSIVIRNAGTAMFSPAALAMLSDTMPLQRQNTVMGIYGVCEDAGVTTGTAFGGLIWGALGQQPTFLIAAAALVSGAVLCLTLLKNKALGKPKLRDYQPVPAGR